MSLPFRTLRALPLCSTTRRMPSGLGLPRLSRPSRPILIARHTHSESPTDPSLSAATTSPSTPTTPTPPAQHDLLTPTIARVLTDRRVGDSVVLTGWIRSVRKQKAFAFIELHDGSNLSGIQVIFDRPPAPADQASPAVTAFTLLTTGASIRIRGTLAPGPPRNPSLREVHATEVTVLGTCPVDTYPLQKKYHRQDFVRALPHLRPRTRTFNALLRIRDGATQRLHGFFREQDFVQVHTPILTSHDCEGGGEVFKVTTATNSGGETAARDTASVSSSQPSPMLTSTGSADEGTTTAKSKPSEFFGRPTFTTVSAQLHAEVMANAFQRVYTFNPTFRAEPSMTTRHLSEFWMLEAEMAFLTDLSNLVGFSELMVRDTAQFLLDHYTAELDYFAKRAAEPTPANTHRAESGASAGRPTMSLTDRWRALTGSKPYTRMTYTEAVEILGTHAQRHPGRFVYPVDWGMDLQHEHEKFLVDEYCRGPVFVQDFPAAIKAFYMKVNTADPQQQGSNSSSSSSSEVLRAMVENRQTVASVDLLVPGPGELIGGSLREHRIDLLTAQLHRAKLPVRDYEWYLDLRRFGSTPHGGFGLGFDRFVQMMCGVESLRDVIPFARYPGTCQL